MKYGILALFQIEVMNKKLFIRLMMRVVVVLKY